VVGSGGVTAREVAVGVKGVVAARAAAGAAPELQALRLMIKIKMMIYRIKSLGGITVV
jgi:hypothetical protein